MRFSLMNKPAVVALLLVLLTMPFIQASCKKDKPKEEEPTLIVSLDPAPVNPVRAMGANYDFKVVVSSKMPREGVSIEVFYSKDSDNTSLFSQSYSTTTAPFNVSIGGIPFNQMGTVKVVVTSKTKVTNKATIEFKLVRK